MFQGISMFVLKKILTPFLIPPGLFIFLFMVVGIWFFCKNRRKMSYCWFFMAAILWLASIKPVGNFFMSPLEYSYIPPKSFSGDVIIVLGGGMKENVPDFSGSYALSSDGLERAFTAARINKKTDLPIILSGGAVFAKKSEAEVGKRFLTDIGIPGDKIIIENKSRDTYENAVFSREICIERGFKKIILVTSAYHMPRAAMIFKKIGFKDIVYYPAGYKTSKPFNYYYPDFLPGDTRDLSSAIKEYIGLVFYKIYYL